MKGILPSAGQRSAVEPNWCIQIAQAEIFANSETKHQGSSEPWNFILHLLNSILTARILKIATSKDSKLHVQFPMALNAFLTDDDEALEFKEEVTQLNMVPKLLGRVKLKKWKRRAGRAKDWKQQSYAKIATQRQRLRQEHLVRRVTSMFLNVSEFVPRYSGLELSFHVANINMPATAYKYGIIRPKMKSRPEVINVSAIGLLRGRHESVKKCPKIPFFEERPVINTRKSGQRKSFSLESSLFEDDVQSFQQQTSQNGPTQPANQILQTIDLHYPGEILLFPYKILIHLRSESHHEVYTGESVSTGLKYEIKAYTLSGIPANQRKRRVENLKKSTALPSFVTSFNWKGKKYAIFIPQNDRKGTEMKKLKLGAIGRRNTKEYDEAFPKLRAV